MKTEKIAIFSSGEIEDNVLHHLEHLQDFEEVVGNPPDAPTIMPAVIFYRKTIEYQANRDNTNKTMIRKLWKLVENAGEATFILIFMERKTKE